MKHPVAAIAFSITLVSCTSTPQAQEPAKPADSNIISMETAAQSRAGVKVQTVDVASLIDRLQVTGTVQPVDSRVSDVRSIARGRLLDVRARVGDRVHAGQLLASIDNFEAAELTAQLASARAELQRAKVLLAAVSLQLDRNRKLSEIGAAPLKDFEQSQAEHQAMQEGIRAQDAVVAGLTQRLQRFGVTGAGATTPITAPFAGIVTTAHAAPGEVVDSSTALFTIADISTVWVQGEVYEKDIGRIQVGQAAVIHADAYPGQPFSGRVTYISDVLDPQTRTAKVRCELPNPGFRLKLDMFATAQLPTTFSRQALAVPVGAIQQLEGAPVVFVQHAPTRFEARRITPGSTVGDRVEVVQGLRAGEAVVVLGSFHLKSIVAGKDLGEE